MKNGIKTEFDRLYEALNGCYVTEAGIADKIPADFKFAGLNTERYITYLNDCIDDNGNRYFKTKDTKGIHVHHIWPISLGGPDKAWNRIDLKYYQHRDAHLKLAIDNPDCLEAQRAAQRLCYDPETGKLIKTADYIKVLKNIARLTSIRNIKNNPNKGNHMTDAEKAMASERGKRSSKSGNSVIVTYKDGSPSDIFDSVSDVGRAYFWNYENPYGQVNKILNQGRQIPKHLSDIIASIEYLHPDDVNHENNADNSRPVIGIDIKTADETIVFNSTRAAARAVLKNNLFDTSNYEDPESTLASKISDSADNNKPNRLRADDKLTYDGCFGYYWVDADATPQFKGIIKKFIKNNF